MPCVTTSIGRVLTSQAVLVTQLETTISLLDMTSTRTFTTSACYECAPFIGATIVVVPGNTL